MTEKEFAEKIQSEARETVEFEQFTKETEDILKFLADYIPESKNDEVSLRLTRYSEKAGALAQRIQRLGEEIAEAEDY